MAIELVNGKCPVCDTQVEHVIDGVRMHFKPHEDPEWCRAAAVCNVKMLKRALEQSGEERGLSYQRESYYRQAFGAALRELSEQTNEHPDEWRERVGKRVKEEMQRAKERQEINLMMAKREGLL